MNEQLKRLEEHNKVVAVSWVVGTVGVCKGFRVYMGDRGLVEIVGMVVLGCLG